MTVYGGTSRFTVASILAEGPADAMTAGERLALEAERARDKLRDQLAAAGVDFGSVTRDAVEITITYKVTLP